MTAKSYSSRIFQKYRWFLLGISALYLLAWVYSYLTGTIDGERPLAFVALAKFALVTFFLLMPTIIIFADSLKRQKYAGGYVVAGLVFNIYALGAYLLKRRKEKKAKK